MAQIDRLAALPDEDVLAIAAVIMGETLEAGSNVVDELGTSLKVDMAELWEADEAFVELIRDKQVLTAIVTEVAGAEAAAANAGETGKVLKAIIRDCLAGDNGREKVKTWVPRWLLFPEGHYRGPAAPDQAAETMAGQAGADDAGQAGATEAEANADQIGDGSAGEAATGPAEADPDQAADALARSGGAGEADAEPDAIAAE